LEIIVEYKRIEDILRGSVAIGTLVEVRGWVRTRRDSKAGLSFVTVNDGSSVNSLQIVAKSNLSNYESDIKRLTTSCAIVARGEVVASLGKGQTVELAATEIEVVGWVDDPETYPIQPKAHTVEYLREMAHLRARTSQFAAIARIRHSASFAAQKFFHENKYQWVHTPLITGSDCEGAGEAFRVSSLDFANMPKTPDGQPDFKQDFFGKPVHLTVSGQLNVETYCLALGKVYTFGPTFRAEKSNTRRHLSEFWMIEPETAFADLSDNIKLAEDFIKYVCGSVVKECPDDLGYFVQHVDPKCVERTLAMIAAPFTRMEYTEAIRILGASGEAFQFPVSWGMDLQSEHERYLAEKVVQGPVVLMNYPKDIKAFYMRMNSDEKTVAAMDIIVPGIGEIIGGSQREERLDYLDKRMDEMKLSREEYWWYRDLRRYGTVPHAGFGLGLERLLMYLTGTENIRDVIPFPRATGQASF
jgi:asparaginyl-tRNA synthetase